MLRKLLCATILLLSCIGVTFADEIRAIILKVEGNEVTFAQSKGKGERGEPKKLPVADNVKVVHGKFNRETKKMEAGEAIESGLKNEIFSSEKIGEKGMRATVVTDDENKKITEIRVAPARRKQ
jgi:hypothetical protein